MKGGDNPTLLAAGRRFREPAGSPTARLLLGWLALVLLGCAAGALWVSVVGSAESDVMREVVAARTPALNALARAATWAGSAFLLVPLALICCLLLVWAGRRREALAVALSLGGAMALASLVKQLVSRARPAVEHLQAVSGWSWPSGHATQASAFWFSLVLLLPVLGASRGSTRVAAALALLIVLAVAASRVCLGVHYPADVVAGAALGASWTVYVWRCVRAGEC